MNEQLYILRTVKYKSEADIITVVKKIVHELLDHINEEDILAFINDHAIDCRQRGEELLFVVLLSFVLGDIADQAAKDLREDNINKIRAICEQREINYHLLSNLASHESELIRIVMST